MCKNSERKISGSEKVGMSSIGPSGGKQEESSGDGDGDEGGRGGDGQEKG